VYGSNVLIAVIAAVAAVILLNAVVDYGYRKLDPAWREWARLDLTATRSQTLAPQTRQVLEVTDRDIRLVAVLRDGDTPRRDVADLLAEFDRYSPRLSVETIHPDREPQRLEAFYESLQSRFNDATAPLRSAVDRGMVTLEQVRAELESLTQTLDELVDATGEQAGRTREQLLVLSGRLHETLENYDTAAAQLEAGLSAPLPAYGNARNDLAGAFRRLDNEVLGPYRQAFARVGRDRSLPMIVRNGLLEADSQMEELQQELQPAIDALLAADSSPTYDRLLATMGSGEVLVLLSENRERAIPLDSMFVAAGDSGGGGEQPARFVGEERLAGALLTLNLEHPPRVVFVSDSRAGAFGEGGNFRHVAERLVTLGFEVGQWQVGGDTGAAMPSDAIAGPTVWLIPALDAVKVSGADREAIADQLNQKLAAGDGVMLLSVYDPESPFREKDPILAVAEENGLVPKRDAVVLSEGVGADRLPRAEAAAAVNDWPDDSPLRHALAGQEALFVLAHPVEIEKKQSVEAWPIVMLEQARQWVPTGLMSNKEITEARFDESMATESVIIAASAELQDGGRMMLFGEPHWPTDRLAAGRLGNSELFINSVYWLAGLDNAIAATARTQDIRRVGPIGDGQQLALRWILLAGLPALALLAGVIMWQVRRRG
jgi:hypothetical protein